MVMVDFSGYQLYTPIDLFSSSIELKVFFLSCEKYSFYSFEISSILIYLYFLNFFLIFSSSSNFSISCSTFSSSGTRTTSLATSLSLTIQFFSLVSFYTGSFSDGYSFIPDISNKQSSKYIKIENNEAQQCQSYFTQNIILQLMIPIQEEFEDPLFMETAVKLGYRKQDIQALDYEKFVRESFPILKGKSEIQQNFYLKKKAEAHEIRRQKIIKQVNGQVKKQLYRESKKKNNFNPIVTQLLKEHQIRCEKKLKYLEKVKMTKKKHQFKQINNTIDLGKTSPNFSSLENNSRVSRKSIQSSSSNRSDFSRSSKNSSYKNRLNLVRQKEKEVEQFKKQEFFERQKQSKKKFQRAEQDKINYSRKLKIRSEVTSQAAREKKKYLNFIQNQQIRDHIEKLQYKVLKHEYIRQKNQEKIKNAAHNSDSGSKRQIRSIMQKNQRENHRSSLENKMRTVQINKQRIQNDKLNQYLRKNESRQARERYAKKHQEFQARENEQRKRITLFHEMRSQESAEMKRKQAQNEKKLKIIESRIKEEINKKNRNSLQIRNKIEMQQKLVRSQNKMVEVKEIEQLKKRLVKERSLYTPDKLRYGRSKNSPNSHSFY